VKTCKDCGSTTRKLDKPGPRCATCWRTIVKQRKALAHAKHVEKTYGITANQYELLYAGQGGLCVICHKAKGISKRLAVDHDHATGKVRGLLCTTCNTIVIGRYDQAALLRAVEYLNNPPAQRILGEHA
jgi:hypothetical protein